MAQVAVTARITGRVQGVAFRAWTRSEAQRQGLSGWVRNEPDGSVKALLMGPPDSVASMLDSLQNGPPSARVSDVETEDTVPDPSVSGFQIAG